MAQIKVSAADLLAKHNANTQDNAPMFDMGDDLDMGSHKIDLGKDKPDSDHEASDWLAANPFNDEIKAIVASMPHGEDMLLYMEEAAAARRMLNLYVAHFRGEGLAWINNNTATLVGYLDMSDGKDRRPDVLMCRAMTNKVEQEVTINLLGVERTFKIEVGEICLKAQIVSNCWASESTLTVKVNTQDSVIAQYMQRNSKTIALNAREALPRDFIILPTGFFNDGSPDVLNKLYPHLKDMLVKGGSQNVAKATNTNWAMFYVMDNFLRQIVDEINAPAKRLGEIVKTVKAYARQEVGFFPKNPPKGETTRAAKPAPAPVSEEKIEDLLD
jgi:hypothetical protein